MNQFPLPLKSQFAEFLIQMGKAEEGLQSVRRQLCLSTRFHPLTCFSRVDMFNRNRIQARDLLFYLNQQDIVVDEDELYILFKDFDLQRKGTISQEGFKRQLLSQEDSSLVQKVYQRKSVHVTRQLNRLIGFDSETAALLKVFFQKKISVYHLFQNERRKLHENKQFSIPGAYRLLDKKSGSVDVFAVEGFFRSVGYKVQKADCQRILRLFNQNSGESQVSYSRFSQFLHPFYNGYYPAYFQLFKERHSLEKKLEHSQMELQQLQLERQKAHLRIMQLTQEINFVKSAKERQNELNEQHLKKKQVLMMRQAQLLNLQRGAVLAQKSVSRSRERAFERELRFPYG